VGTGASSRSRPPQHRHALAALAAAGAERAAAAAPAASPFGLEGALLQAADLDGVLLEQAASGGQEAGAARARVR
jgi:hypothetical protein